MRVECDVVIIGGGITAAMVAQKLVELRPNWSIIVVEAGKRLFDNENRLEYRERISTTARTSGLATSSPDQSRARRDFAHDGGRRIGAALGRRLQSLLGRRHAVEIDVRPGGRLADRVDGAREVLLRSRAAHRRLRGAESAAGGPAHRAVSDAGDADDLQPDAAQGWAEKSGIHSGRRRRRRTRSTATAAAALPALQHVRDLSDGRALLTRLDVQAAAGREEDRAARSDAGAQAGARGCDRSHRRGAGGHAKTAADEKSSTARGRSLSRPATAGARICCSLSREQSIPERPREHDRTTSAGT